MITSLAPSSVSDHYPPASRYHDWPTLGESCPAVALTPAERRVLALVQQGLSNKEIASVLDRAESTIKHQVAECLRKFRVPSRTRLIVLLR